MASTDFNLVSISDSKISEVKDCELEVEGSPNSSDQVATDVLEATQEACVDKPFADAEWLALYEQETSTEEEQNTSKVLQWNRRSTAKDNTLAKKKGVMGTLSVKCI